MEPVMKRPRTAARTSASAERVATRSRRRDDTVREEEQTYTGSRRARAAERAVPRAERARGASWRLHDIPRAARAVPPTLYSRGDPMTLGRPDSSRRPSPDHGGFRGE